MESPKEQAVNKAILILVLLGLLTCIAGIALGGLDDNPSNHHTHSTSTPWPTSVPTTTGKDPIDWTKGTGSW